jgi:hypothetical protein
MEHGEHSSPIGKATGWLGRADFLTGVMCLALAALVLWEGSDYPLGTAGRVGPGYVPRLLGLLMAGIGVLLIVRSFWSTDLADRTMAPRPIVLILASVFAFALAFDRFGLVPAILAAVAIANFAAPDNRWYTAIGIGTVLAVFSWALFVQSLKLPLPVFRM